MRLPCDYVKEAKRVNGNRSPARHEKGASSGEIPSGWTFSLFAGFPFSHPIRWSSAEQPKWRRALHTCRWLHFKVSELVLGATRLGFFHFQFRCWCCAPVVMLSIEGSKSFYHVEWKRGDLGRSWWTWWLLVMVTSEQITIVIRGLQNSDRRHECTVNHRLQLNDCFVLWRWWKWPTREI